LKTCSYDTWQTTGLPCSYVFIVIIARAENPQMYTESFFQLQSFRNIYTGTIPHPHDNPTRDETLILIRRLEEVDSDGSDSDTG
jgi:hypothetical protein